MHSPPILYEIIHPRIAHPQGKQIGQRILLGAGRIEKEHGQNAEREDTKLRIHTRQQFCANFITIPQ